MSRLKELIRELCPDGVEYVRLETIADIGTGSSNTNEGVDDGIYPFFVRSQETLRKNEYEFDETAIITAGDGVGVGKVFHYVEGKYALHQRAYRIHINSSKVLPRFFYLYMKATFLGYIHKNLFHGSVASIRRPMLNAFPVPIPPISVQEEIVCILDSFAEKVEELQDRLYAEVYERKRQYEYYRNQLMNIELDFPKFPLKDIASTFRGEYITKKSAKQGSIPVILGGQEPAYYIDRANHDGEIVVVARSGVSAGFVSYWDEPIFVTDGFGYEAKKSVVIPKYLYYILKNKEKEMNGMKRGAGVPHVSGEALSKLEFPVPTLEIQEQIVLVNEKLDNEYNELFVALEAEIKLCQKQYEYYRDKLLTFKEKSC